jgi:Transposase, Mutator family
VEFARSAGWTSFRADGAGSLHPPLRAIAGTVATGKGATENAAACKALLEDLIERGLNPNRAILVVIDGAKALRRAVLDTLGERALVQRCQAHNKRNLTDSLPERMRASVRAAINQAYASRDPKRARRLLENLAHKLESDHPGAAASLREGVDETLSLMGLRLPQALERVLSSTNLIENLFSRVREIARRVKRWQGGSMILRWTAAGVLEAERHSRKVAGYRALPKLASALHAREVALDRARGVDNRKQAAYLNDYWAATQNQQQSGHFPPIAQTTFVQWKPAFRKALFHGDFRIE